MFFPGRDAAALLSVSSRLGIDPSARVFDVAGGFLLRLDRPSGEPVPGATRLRELSADLFVPVDADLVPSLLDDEASGIVRDGGARCSCPGSAAFAQATPAPSGRSLLLVAAAAQASGALAANAGGRLLERRIVEVSARVARAVRGRPLPTRWEPKRPGPRLARGRGPNRGELRQAGKRTTSSTPRRKSPTRSRRPRATLDRQPSLPSLHRAPGDTLRDLARARLRRVGRDVCSARRLRWGILDHSAAWSRGCSASSARAIRDRGHAACLPDGPVPTPATRSVVVGQSPALQPNAVYNLFDLLGSPREAGLVVGFWLGAPPRP